jgi:hypothetical protein
MGASGSVLDASTKKKPPPGSLAERSQRQRGAGRWHVAIESELLLPPEAVGAMQAMGSSGTGHVRFELRNVAANYLFERSHKFPGIQPNSGETIRV